MAIIRFILVFLWIFKFVVCQDSCCDFAVDDPMCYSKCTEVYGAVYGHVERMYALAPFCASTMEDFWICMSNSSEADATSFAGQWSGRRCCMYTSTRECENSCKRVKSREALSGCPSRDEILFFKCLERQEMKLQCCRPAAGQCKNACSAIFMQDNEPSASQREAVQRMCADDVIICVNDYLQQIPEDDPEKHLPCCEHAATATCRESCVHSLMTIDNEHEIIDALVNDCGPISFTDPVWQCFLQGATSNMRPDDSHGGTIQVIGMDGAKLHCCTKASSTTCQELCIQTHGREFSSTWQQFENRCRFRESEKELNHCLHQVDAPCSLGCNSLQYCTQFNHRPTEMFQSCTRDAELIAEKTVQVWQEGIISLPFMTDIPVKDISRCQPESWKTIACALEIKPCQSEGTALRICYSDCINVLSECLDFRRLQAEVTVESMCATLSPTDTDSTCLSLTHFMDEDTKKETTEVTHPCQPNPCNNSDVCIVRRRKCHHNDSAHCRPYVCRPGCRLGEVSQFYAIKHSYVRVPSPELSDHNCHRICQCRNDGLLHRCYQVACVRHAKCLLDTGRIEEHNSKFEMGCNKCICYDGKVTCTRRLCYNTPPGLPCGCDTSYNPVTASNGVTYHNLCLARCHSIAFTNLDLLDDIENPCNDVTCPVNQNCVTKRQACLHAGDCPQYTCVAVAEGCNKHDHTPVCDTDGVEHLNLCRLWQHGRTFDYWGHCMTGCRNTGPVCGLDRVQYRSECHAWAAMVPVDYLGQCRVTPSKSANEDAYMCAHVQCPPIAGDKCQPIVPTGACCPVCGTEIRVLYSPALIQSTLRATNDLPISLHELTRTLAYHLSAAECDIFSYFSIEGDLILLVLSTVEKPSHVQIEACIQEASQLASNINSQTAAISSYAMTSSLLSAELRAPVVSMSSAANPLSSSIGSFYRIPYHSFVLCFVSILSLCLSCDNLFFYVR